MKISQKTTYHSQTQSLCPVCLKPLMADIVFEAGSVFQIKACTEHGNFKTLIEKDLSYYLKKAAFDKPGTITPPNTTSRKNCPFDCGLCPEHKQHSCIGLMEITNACDQSCPVCYAKASRSNHFLSLSQIDKMLDFFVQAEGGQAEILQISGGEPTLHRDLIEIIDLAMDKNINFIMLNTNGNRLAYDKTLVKSLSKYKARFEIYLKFNGFSPTANEYFENKTDAHDKVRAIENLLSHKIPITLVTMVENGINEKEIGHILDFALCHSGIRGINFQCVAKYDAPDSAMESFPCTVSEIINCIDQQSNQMISRDDIFPLPCNIHNNAITFLFRKKNSFAPVTQLVDISEHLDLVGNTLNFDAAAISKDILEKTRQQCCSFDLLDMLKPVIPKGWLKKGKAEQKRFIDNNTFRISITSFLDRYNFDSNTIKKECVHVITPDLKRIPFSAYNLVYRNSMGA
ncbi:MAG: radical SAM protein [Desulfobacteraceae bacterium]|nr:radical SAM protein [Desulfobacteraceae bacterium]